MPSFTASIDVPRVAGYGFGKLDESAPVIAATPHGIAIDGTPLASISNGAVDPHAVDAVGLNMPRVTQLEGNELFPVVYLASIFE